MFDPLFKVAEVRMSRKTDAPLALIRKLAAESVPKEEREEQIKRWDKESSAPVETIRKVAQAISFDDVTQPPPLTTEEVILQQKLACVEDEELFKTAFFLADDAEDALRTYESLGGKYVVKVAFGTQMFDSRQMAGSPATAGGMSRRSTTTMPSPMQAAPTRSPATSSPKSQAQGVTSAPSATNQTPAPAAPMV